MVLVGVNDETVVGRTLPNLRQTALDYLNEPRNTPVRLRFARPRLSTNDRIMLGSMFHSSVSFLIAVVACLYVSLSISLKAHYCIAVCQYIHVIHIHFNLAFHELSVCVMTLKPHHYIEVNSNVL